MLDSVILIFGDTCSSPLQYVEAAILAGTLGAEQAAPVLQAQAAKSWDAALKNKPL